MEEIVNQEDNMDSGYKNSVKEKELLSVKKEDTSKSSKSKS